MGNKNKTKKYIYLFIILVLTIGIFWLNNSVFAKINEGYATETISSTWLNNAQESSAIANSVGSFLLWIAGFIEFAISKLSLVLSGQDTTIMPWADAIIFNAVPVLDINFINPSGDSILNSMTNIIQKIYYIVLALSIVFLSFAVIIMAIKLAISSIAEEKAKYKQAIVAWVKGIILLFVIHFVMAFVFFLNETLVEVASNIASRTIEEESYSSIFTTSIYYEMLKKDASEIGTTDQKNIINDNPVFFSALMSESNDLIHDLFGFEKLGGADTNWTFYDSDKIADVTVKKTESIERVVAVYRLSDSITLSEDQLKKLSEASTRKDALNDIMSGKDYCSNMYDFLNDKYKSKDCLEKRREAFANILIKYTAFQTQIEGSSGDYTTMAKKTPITNLAEYFRKNAYVPKADSYVKTDINLSFAMMYLIFAVQSLIYFYSYTRRLFFVIIFALMAPVIVVWDFVWSILK